MQKNKPASQIADAELPVPADLSMKVGLVSLYPPPLAGASVYGQRLLAALRQRGLAVELLAHKHSEVSGADRQEGVRPMPGEQTLLTALDSGQYDVVHDFRFHTQWMRRNPLPLWKYARKAQNSRTSLVVTCGAGIFAKRVREGSWWQKKLLKRALRSVDLFISKQTELLETLGELGFPSGRMAYLSSSLPLGELPPLHGEVADFAASHEPLIVTSGGYCKNLYRMHQVVQAAGRLKGKYPRLGVILGTCTPISVEDMRRVDNAVEQSNLRGQVHVAKDYDRFPSLLAAADVSVRASVVEGSSNAVFESLLVGCPTVVSDIPGRPEGAIRYRADDMEDMTRVLGEVIDSPPPRNPDPEALREARQNVDALLRVYAHLAGR